jgi:predicted phage terminase large subunit-like protein
MPAIPTLAAIRAERERRTRLREAEEFARDAKAIRERSSTLLGFVREFWSILEPGRPFVTGWAIEAVALHLEAVTRGDIQYLLINVPPGMMKSLLVGVFWPAWEWATVSTSLGFLASSFSLDNVLRDNLKMRRLVESEKYRAAFPHVRPGGKWGERRFETTDSGVRGGRSFTKMTGGRGDRVLIDDPHDVDAGESDVQRPAAVKTFREAIPDRLNDMRRSAIVVIMQRLHANDIAGTILKLRLPYVHLNLPMEFEPYREEGGKKIDARCVTHDRHGRELFRDPRQHEGELLFPERFPREVVEGLKIAKGSYAYAGQYQQRPTAREGGLFKRAWFAGKIVARSALPPTAYQRCRAWDFAATEAKPGADPDWTAGLRLLRHGVDYYIEDVRRDRLSPGAVQALVKALAETDPAGTIVRIPVDPAQAGVAQAQSYVTALAGHPLKAERPTGDKTGRALPASIQAEYGHIYLVNSGPPDQGLDPWIELFLDELCAFPTGAHDDQVDAFADAFNELAVGAPIPFESASAGKRETLDVVERDSRYRFGDNDDAASGAGFGSVRSSSQGIAF